jgi:TPP-dependent pyruvate/acetoin dehydrogenase alpha subunit
VPRFRGILVKSGVLTAAKADELTTRIANEMQEAVTFGLNSPFPKLESALEYNYA